ncbi:MAG TPA: hypothetical protein VNB90_16215 [Cytophagaceae bacterium]|jgi:hypothetical protein|nr:hypothetical protein [Cytophagaceae bacterium]
MLTIGILLAELIGSTVALVWITAMLGFCDETHRSEKANMPGKIYAITSVVLACAPLLITAWLGWTYFFSSCPWEQIPLGWWQPVVAAAVCFPVSFGLIYLYDASYRSRI